MYPFVQVQVPASAVLNISPLGSSHGTLEGIRPFVVTPAYVLRVGRVIVEVQLDPASHRWDTDRGCVGCIRARWMTVDSSAGGRSALRRECLPP